MRSDLWYSDRHHQLDSNYIHNREVEDWIESQENKGRRILLAFIGIICLLGIVLSDPVRAEVLLGDASASASAVGNGGADASASGDGGPDCSDAGVIGTDGRFFP
jgi:hypothetical protein